MLLLASNPSGGGTAHPWQLLAPFANASYGSWNLQLSPRRVCYAVSAAGLVRAGCLVDGACSAVGVRAGTHDVMLRLLVDMLSSVPVLRLGAHAWNYEWMDQRRLSTCECVHMRAG